MNMVKTIDVTIASRPGTWQNFLKNELSSYPFVRIVGVTTGSLTALKISKQHQPGVLLIDSSIPIEEVIAILESIMLENPGILTIVIADTTQQRRKLTHAGADHVVSTFEFKLKIQEIFNQFNEKLPDTSASINEDLAENI
jgi:chemotaxis response regulator CheB